MNVQIAGILALALTAVKGAIPENFPRCHYADEACLVTAANEVIQKYHSSGFKEVDLPPFEPLRIDEIILPRHPTSPVNIEIALRDVELIGLKTMDVSIFKGLKEDLSGIAEIAGTIAQLDLDTNYTIDGRILVLPIAGQGPATLKCKTVRFSYSFDLKPLDVNGKEYLSLHRVKLDLNPEHVYFQFNSLFNGDKALTDATNKFINEHWREIFDELKGGVSKEISLILKKLVNRVLAKYPREEYFLSN